MLICPVCIIPAQMSSTTSRTSVCAACGCLHSGGRAAPQGLQPLPQLCIRPAASRLRQASFIQQPAADYIQYAVEFLVE